MEKSSEETPSKAEVWYVCKYCGRGYKNARSLISHKRENHMLELIERKRQKILHSDSNSGSGIRLSSSHPSSEQAYGSNTDIDCSTEMSGVPIIIKVETKSVAHHSLNALTNSSFSTSSRRASQKDYICQLCFAEFQSVSKLFEHQVVHSRKYSCHSCTMTYDRLATLNAHVASVHCFSELSISNLNKNFHIKSGAGGLSQPVDKVDNLTGTGMKRSNIDVADFQHKCSICFKCFDDEFTLNKHVKNHRRTGKILVCRFCPFTSRHLASLRRHIRLLHQHQHENKCQHCSASFKRLYNLESHVFTVHKHVETKMTQKQKIVKNANEKSSTSRSSSNLKCPYCPKVSKSTGQLRQHTRTHTGEKPFKCQYCPLRSVQSSTIKRHMETVHLQDHKFKCFACSASYAQRQNLNAHINTVHECKEGRGVPEETATAKTEMDFAYAIAKQDFSTNQTKKQRSSVPVTRNRMNKLYTKLKTKNINKPAHPKKKCKYCPYTAAFWALKTHEDFAHSTQQPNKCQFCPASYARIQNLEYRVKKLHPECPKSPKEKNAQLRQGQDDFTSLNNGNNTMPVLENQLCFSQLNHVPQANEFVCSICHMNYDRKSRLEIHVRTHPSFKPYMCANTVLIHPKSEST